MHVDAACLDARELGGQPVKGDGLRERDAELVLGLAGRDLVVGLGVHVGVYAERDAGGLA